MAWKRVRVVFVAGSISEKLKIVQLSFEPGVSVAEVARAHGVNANQVFTWRRAFERGELNEPSVALFRYPASVQARVVDFPFATATSI
jgi:transposase